MTHLITVELSEETYQPLVAKAQEAGKSVEAYAQTCLESVVSQRGSGIRKWMGAVASGVPDAAERHDYYLGQALAEELKSRRGE